MVSAGKNNRHIGLFCDNMTAVQWLEKKSTVTSLTAGHLPRALALRIHINRATPLQPVHIAGEKNQMVDTASKSKDPRFTASNKPFLTIFNTLFPLKEIYWQECIIPKKTWSKVTSALLGKQLTIEFGIK